MSRNIFIFLFIIFNISLLGFNNEISNYKVRYKITYLANLSTKLKKIEFGILMIEGAKGSYYATENVFKSDSIFRAIKESNLSPQDIMTNSDFRNTRTNFQSFVKKDYSTQNLQVSQLILIDNYIYNQKGDLKWNTNVSDTVRIKNYLCNKATTQFEGREYEAWYTTDLPISDGPYKFCGLPGLILKINDIEKQFVFELESFEKFEGKKYEVPFLNRKSYEVSYEKFKSMYKSFNENPMGAFEERGIKNMTLNGNEVTPELMKERKPNTIERY